MTTKKITLITRLRTENAGNEALSETFIRFLDHSLPSAEIRVLDRIPQAMSHLNCQPLRQSSDPIAMFDAIAEDLAERARNTKSATLAPTTKEARAFIVEKPRLRSPIMSWLKKHVRLRSRLSSAGLLNKEAADITFATLAWSDAVVWNPAGEFHPKGNSDQCLRLLLLARMVQKLGQQLSIVNHSLEATDPLINQLIAHVYKDAQFVSVREQGSYDAAMTLGIPAPIVHIIPDLVFLAALPEYRRAATAPFSIKSGSIVLSINGLEAERGGDGWDLMLAKLSKMNAPITFLSNSMNDDIPFAREFKQKFDIDVPEVQLGYLQMLEAYRDASVVISSRLHASILALNAGVPVVSIEPQQFKLTAIFEQLQYPFATERMGEPGWAERVVANTAAALEKRDEVVAEGGKALDRQVGRILEGYAPMLGMLA